MTSPLVSHLAQVTEPNDILFPYFVRKGSNPHAFTAGFINIEGKVVISDRFQDAGKFQDGTAPVQNENLWGVVDVNGNIIVPCQWRFPVRFVNGFAMVREMKSGREQRGFLRRDGEWVVKPKYHLATAFSCGLAQVFNGLHYGYINQQGTEVIPLTFEDSRRFSEDIAPVRRLGQWGYIDTDGEFTISPRFDFALPFSEGIARAQKAGKWGLIDHSGTWIVEPQFEILWDMHCGRSAAGVSQSMGFINVDGEFVIEPNYDYVSNFQEDLAWVTRTGQKERVCVDLFGQNAFASTFLGAEPFYGGLSLVETESSIGYLDKTGGFVWQGDFVERSTII
jgi:hypothetical protein